MQPPQTSSEERFLLKQLGFYLKKFRTKAGVTRKALAKLLNISEPKLQSYELGDVKIPFSTLKQISEYFKVDFKLSAGSFTVFEHNKDYNFNKDNVDILVSLSYLTQEEVKIVRAMIVLMVNFKELKEQ